MLIGTEAVFTRPMRNIVRSGNLYFTDIERFSFHLIGFNCTKGMSKNNWPMSAHYKDLLGIVANIDQFEWTITRSKRFLTEHGCRRIWSCADDRIQHTSCWSGQPTDIWGDGFLHKYVYQTAVEGKVDSWLLSSILWLRKGIYCQKIMGMDM